MDLRAFGVGPRVWLEQIPMRTRDHVLIGFSVAMVMISVALSLLGFGKFWVPHFLLRL